MNQKGFARPRFQSGLKGSKEGKTGNNERRNQCNLTGENSSVVIHTYSNFLARIQELHLECDISADGDSAVVNLAFVETHNTWHPNFAEEIEFSPWYRGRGQR